MNTILALILPLYLLIGFCYSIVCYFRFKNESFYKEMDSNTTILFHFIIFIVCYHFILSDFKQLFKNMKKNTNKGKQCTI